MTEENTESKVEEVKSEEQTVSPVVVAVSSAPAGTSLKLWIAIIVLALGWAGTVFFVYQHHKKVMEEKEKELIELSQANEELEKALTRVESDLTALENKQQKATELVESTSVVIDELKVAASTTGNTIKDIRDNQERIKKTVISLIEDYNRILEAFQESEDGNTEP